MIKRISIQNFKSLKNVTLDLQRVNLLIGPNNSGKTNFLKGLEFLKRIEGDAKVNNDVFTQLAFQHEVDKSIAFEIGYVVGDNRVKQHSIDILLKDSNDRECDVKFEGRENPYFPVLFSHITNVHVYQPNSQKMVDSYPLNPDVGQVVHEDASNIVAFLEYIRDEHTEEFEQIQKGLNTCIPEFQGLRFKTVQPTEEQKKIFGDKTFKKVGFYSKLQKTTYWSDEVSEGVLYFLALLCIVHQPFPPKLLLLEEPERGIHPRRIQEVMDFIFRLAEEKDIQVIMTSHNENVVNYFSEMPESIFVFDKDEEGATQVRNLLNEIILPSHQKSEQHGIETIDFTSDLGKNWVYGLLGGVPE